MTKHVVTYDVDRQAYCSAWQYLLGIPGAGITEELLRHYLSPPTNRDTPTEMSDVFRRLVESAQNRGMMATGAKPLAHSSLSSRRAAYTQTLGRERFGPWTWVTK